VFDLLLRLRQAVNHPYLVIFSSTALNAGQGATAALPPPQSSDVLCVLCHDPAEDAVWSACCHSFCKVCITEYIDAAPVSGATCPACSVPLTINVDSKMGHAAPGNTRPISAVPMVRRRWNGQCPAASSILSRIDLRNFQSSTKIEALREELHKMISADPSSKAIVFSQFTSMLDLCHFRLEQTGIKCVRLQGSMSMDARDRAISSFTNDPDVRVFLMSLKAGGVALNLTAASHAFVVDSWWNPATEWQAMDRIHRLGQYKPMRCVKFVIGGSIEERIVKLQEKKRLIFEAISRFNPPSMVIDSITLRISFSWSTVSVSALAATSTPASFKILR